MGNKLFVGSLSWDTTDDSLRNLFATVGTVVSARVITDKFSGRSRGFGFVEMSTPDEAEKALNELNGKDLDGRAINVSEAKPQEDRPSGGGRQGGGYGRDDRNDRRGGGGRY